MVIVVSLALAVVTTTVLVIGVGGGRVTARLARGFGVTRARLAQGRMPIPIPMWMPMSPDARSPRDGRREPVQALALHSQKSSHRAERRAQRRARIALAPLTVQCIPARLSRTHAVVLQPASTTPDPMDRPSFWKRG